MAYFSLRAATILLITVCTSCMPGDALAPFSTIQDCPECPELVVVPPGKFMMGSTAEERQPEIALDNAMLDGMTVDDVRGPEVLTGMADEEPKHEVTIGYSFALGRYPITRAEFAAFVAETGYHTPGCSVFVDTGFVWMDTISWPNPHYPSSDRHPVVCITWQDAQAYVQWLSQKTGHRYRLPSEAEWEYAARAGTTTLRWWGNSRDSACYFGNVRDSALMVPRIEAGRVGGAPIMFHCNDGYEYIAPVNRPGVQPNPWGLYEMLGNIFEMTQDRYHINYEGAPTDGSAWEEGGLPLLTGRGGGITTFPSFVRSAYRGFYVEGFKVPHLGFRVVREM
jgi:formylglycine-generating enzyme required for sulfatase activity